MRETHTRELTVGGPATGWTVTLERTADGYTVTLGTDSGPVSVFTGGPESKIAAWWAYDHITVNSAYTDAWNRAVNA